MTPPLPYRIAVLCYLFDEQGRILLLHRSKSPNRELFSPIGGKLEQGIGESPATCALREIQEETGLSVDLSRLHLTGIVSETGYEDQCHWLMFLYEVTGAVDVVCRNFDEGCLEWHNPATVNQLALPATDREVIWPLFWRYRGSFFSVHIDCRGGTLKWRLEQPASDSLGDQTGSQKNRSHDDR